MGQQVKLFFRSKLRIVLLIVLVLGSSRHFIQAFYYFQQFDRFDRIAVIWGTLQKQMSDFIFIFILLLFLTFDYFREADNANAIEIMKASRYYFRHDWKTFSVLVVILILYSVCLLSFYLITSGWNHMLPGEICLYFIKMIGLYVFLNGLVAILLGWLISKLVGRLIGYLCIILAACLFSPILSSTLGVFALWDSRVFHFFRVFMILPLMGTATRGIGDQQVMFAVNLTLAARTIFWLGGLAALLVIYYLRVKNQRIHPVQWGLLGTGILCAIGAWIYSGLPASFYNHDSSMSDTDSQVYDQRRYVIQGVEQRSQENAFTVQSYEMKFKLGRQMKAEVILYLENTTYETYDMTLYHLYEVDSVTDQNGQELPFRREEDYLSVDNAFGNLSEIHISYHGGGAIFYSNRDQVYLPGWFAYYPIPGWHEIYDAENYQYYCNILPYQVPFDVMIDARTTVYSELDRITGNHFTGISSGPTFTAGFVKEVCTEDGIRVIYPYLNENSNPESKYVDYPALLEAMRALGKKTIIVMPVHAGDGAYINEGDYVVDYVSLDYLLYEYENMGEFVRVPRRERTEEDDIQAFQQIFPELLEYEDYLYYDMLVENFVSTMGKWGYTEEDFEEFVIEYFDQDTWDFIKELDNRYGEDSYVED